MALCSNKLNCLQLYKVVSPQHCHFADNNSLLQLFTTLYCHAQTATAGTSTVTFTVTCLQLYKVASPQHCHFADNNSLLQLFTTLYCHAQTATAGTSTVTLTIYNSIC